MKNDEYVCTDSPYLKSGKFVSNSKLDAHCLHYTLEKDD